MLEFRRLVDRLMQKYICLNAGELRMKIKINNVAKIVNAEISLKGISVIAGLNSTGKSTILKSIYMGLNTFKNTNEKVSVERKRSIEVILRKMESYFDENDYMILPQAILYDFAELINEKIDSFLNNPNDFKLFKELFRKVLQEYSDFLQRVDCDKLYSDEFLMPIFEKVKIEFQRTKEDYLKYIAGLYLHNVFNDQLNNINTRTEAHIEIESEKKINIIKVVDNKIQEISGRVIAGSDVIYLPTYSIIDFLNENRYIRPAYSPESDIRNYLLNEEVDNASFEQHLEIEENVNSIKEILDEVVHGKLKRTSLGELRYNDNETSGSYSLRNVASGIKPFLLIQSLVESGKLKSGSVLLMDEPESNLHPEWHLTFAELLVLMYKNMGIISVVNSHSPYFIRAVEVKLADYGMTNVGRYYLMEEKGKNCYITTDVSNKTNEIYQKLYKPLEYL